MDIGSAFTFMFDDEEWVKKLAIGGLAMLLGIIIIPLFAVYGYMLQTIKNVRDGQPSPLPEWNDLGNLIMKGLIVTVIGFVYFIPVILFYCVLIGAQVALQDPNADMGGTLGAVVACLWCLVVLFGILASAILPAAIIRYAEFDTFSSAFQVGEIFSFISNNLGDYVIVVLLSWVAGFIAFFGIILCGIGIYFTNFWAFLVAGHLFGQLARKAGASV